MRRILLIIAVAAIMAVMIGTSALSANAQDRPDCDPWTWNWYRSASGHWYWQWHQDCWNPAQGYYTNWDGWGWY
jgi:hypothetical protein